VSRPPCTIDGCDSPSVGRGWCRKHYLRWYKTGDPNKVRKSIRTGRRLHDPGEHNYTPLETPCREWLGLRDSKGYGILGRDHRRWRVHRYVWSSINGPIPDGLVVMHRCDNPPCYRLDHLVLGTPGDNTADMLSKERQANGGRIATADEVVAMRIDCANGMSVRQVAAKYGFSASCTHHILTGSTWRHVGGPLYTPNPKHRRRAA